MDTTAPKVTTGLTRLTVPTAYQVLPEHQELMEQTQVKAADSECQEAPAKTVNLDLQAEMERAAATELMGKTAGRFGPPRT